MPSALSELCKLMQNCTEKLEEEIKNNINDCHKLLLSNQATETKLALEKAKDYHYKEILDFLKDVNNFTPEELKRYSYVQRQVNAFSSTEEVVNKREKRRVASEVSLESLEAWEVYLEKKAEEEKQIQEEKSAIPKRKRMNNRRRKKKFVSSTFNNFLGDRMLDSISEDGVSEEDFNLNDRLLLEENRNDNEEEYSLESAVEVVAHDHKNPVHAEAKYDPHKEQLDRNSSEGEDENSDQGEDHKEASDKYSLLNIVECISQELLPQDSNDCKPKIVDVVSASWIT
ncbi:hypothetical protein NQ314_000401 [Rhamnusium bicolor]|uniref:Uncharacterized protein n=1 Tax=Rhamnusium bicolor TaxID=1586634 RepID=A0AAV8ZX73_9CUCU|nr:hypothetical protein NQ314_000401 [Rhamnusium bicolor]